jgi:hypothetical protein
VLQIWKIAQSDSDYFCSYEDTTNNHGRQQPGTLKSEAMERSHDGIGAKPTSSWIFSNESVVGAMTSATLTVPPWSPPIILTLPKNDMLISSSSSSAFQI